MLCGMSLGKKTRSARTRIEKACMSLVEVKLSRATVGRSASQMRGIPGRSESPYMYNLAHIRQLVIAISWCTIVFSTMLPDGRLTLGVQSSSDDPKEAIAPYDS
eukprot:gb/GECG01016636.1/.p1 GENE.gb/GECG01016636.1/~~gb/GECG01016636.1/.p1  ORF type:complete len:104 (+),score=8.87 gb/GECG01016636.1/:1-312(+)